MVKNQLAFDFSGGSQGYRSTAALTFDDDGHRSTSPGTWREAYEEFVRENAHLPGAEDLLNVPWEVNIGEGGSDGV